MLPTVKVGSISHADSLCDTISYARKVAIIMTLPLNALRDAAATHLNSVGSLELRSRDKKFAKFYFDHGLLYGVTIRGQEPPLLERLQWSVGHDLDWEEIQRVAASVPADKLKFALLQHQIVTNRLISEVSQDFFLGMTEQIMGSWGDAKTSWSNNDSLPDTEGYTVAYIEVDKLREVLARRENNILQFSQAIDVDPDDIYNIVIQPSTNKNIEINKDAEKLVVSLLNTNSTFDELITSGSMLGPGAIAKAIFSLWRTDALRIVSNDQVVPNPYVEERVRASQAVDNAADHTEEDEDLELPEQPVIVSYSASPHPESEELPVQKVEETDEESTTSDEISYSLDLSDEPSNNTHQDVIVDEESYDIGDDLKEDLEDLSVVLPRESSAHQNDDENEDAESLVHADYKNPDAETFIRNLETVGVSDEELSDVADSDEATSQKFEFTTDTDSMLDEDNFDEAPDHNQPESTVEEESASPTLEQPVHMDSSDSLFDNDDDEEDEEDALKGLDILLAQVKQAVQSLHDQLGKEKSKKELLTSQKEVYEAQIREIEYSLEQVQEQMRLTDSKILKLERRLSATSSL
jgi:hypothetical protein